MKVKIPKKITLQKFAAWIKEYTRCEIRASGGRLNIVVFADNIEAGKSIPLYAEVENDTVQITELADDFYSPEEAWKALEDVADCYPPVPFHEWVQDQYLTAENVSIEKISFV
jgi:hypothetical protein